MAIKYNDATRNRPEGDRVLDAPFLFADLPAFVEQLKDEKAWEKNDRNAITVSKSENATIVLSALKRGASIPENAVDGFLTVLVMEGTLRTENAEGQGDVATGQLITFHPGVQHSLEAVTDTVLLITTSGIKD